MRRSAGRVSRKIARAATEEADADGGEEEEQAAPVGDAGELAADDRPDDRRESAEDGEAPVVTDERAALVDVATGGLGDDDADRSREALHEPGEDERLDRGADRTESGCRDVRADADEERPAAAEPVGQRPGDQLPDGQSDEAGGQRELGR